MDLFAGLTFNWGFSAGDIFKNSMVLIGGLAAFVLLGLAIKFVPELINVLHDVVVYKKNLKESYEYRRKRRAYYNNPNN